MPRQHSPAYRFLVAVGGRPVLRGFPSNFLAGPFFLEAAIANGAATGVDLTAADAWYADPQVRAAYAPANGGAAKQNFTVHIESIQCLIVDGAFQVLIGTTKQKLWTTAYASIRATVGGTTRKFPLDESFDEMIESTHAAATSSPSTGAGSKICGVSWVLPSPIRVDCSQDGLDLVTEADAALGAATNTRIKLGRGSVVIPNNAEDAGSEAQSESCDAGEGNVMSLEAAVQARSRYLGVVSISKGY